MATKTGENLAEENPGKTVDPTVPLAAKAIADSSKELETHTSSTQHSALQEPVSKATSSTGSSTNGGFESKGIVSTAASEVGNVAPLSDVEKKMRRAERFGISVQLSEQEKRNSRAEKFGTRSALQALSTSKSEDLKRSARTERSGITRASTAADDEAKKKARLAKFAPVSKIDPLEEEKRKARAIRFSNAPSSSLSHANVKGDIEPVRVKLPDKPEWLLASLLVGNFITFLQL
ncbi:protein MODIFIER OF SNC1 11-like isoform X2 [Prosopis cineraria]|uniref:protein MODIFIER OF SNC1 11-like isoform X2 n=1 Tax=Prosopis cineraria TaxID=364024 RepID=UPI00240EF422|nr:protein MODIFIER OF SNC1 11-like isoform X2 [Prosopis cineraria]